MSADFFDSNIFVYMFDERDLRKWQIARSLVHDALENGSAVISFQVIQETLNVITRKLVDPVKHYDAIELLDKMLLPLWKVNPSPAFYKRGLDIQSRYQYSFYDSLIISAALEAGCKTLYSEDMQHGQRIEQVTIKNPFLE
jgi:predicted nucleic acid-binding protein